MIIQNMFKDDINRRIGGVIKVDQSDDKIIEQELREYVITRELKKHFVSFFNYYSDSFDVPTDDMGVWVSGFFGSGKSHFLKMLSYLLKNMTVGGKPSVEYFRDKFADDPATFMMIDRATRNQTETILFNIDIEGPVNKDKTAVLRVFAKMFFNHLGFYGENLKVAMLEYYIDQEGKTQEFREAFERHKGKSWLETRRVFAFNKSAIIPSLVEVLGISEADAQAWFSDKSETPLSVASLVADIKQYISKKPKDFRLLFMIDEVGQYVGTDRDLLLNLQSIIEKIGSECGSSVWVICTGQEALDEIIKVRDDEFSRIQARFKTRLSLSSSSVDEVIQKRVLKKTDQAASELEDVYDQNEAILRNLFVFTNSTQDIRGFSGPSDFAENFPFVPYQFILMQKVFAEIRKHGNAGKHLSGGERSMLSGFQEAAQKIQNLDEYALMPFFRFYDTVNSFLDSTIRQVISRCASAAENDQGIEAYDVDVLKLLYMIRYTDEIPSTLDNIVVLMADDLRADKIVMRSAVLASLERLQRENYINRTGDVYHFLTNEEQDVEREINETPIDTSAIVERIGQLIIGDIYSVRKYHYQKYDFPFDIYIDDYAGRAGTGGMVLRLLTVATDVTAKSPFKLMADSKGKEAIIDLAETPYYTSIERSLKIRKFASRKNISQLPKSTQNIIQDHMNQASELDKEAIEQLLKALADAKFYVDGEQLTLRGSDAKTKIDQALEYLVTHVYSELSLITHNIDSDADLFSILSGNEVAIPGMEPNRDAAAKVMEYLEMQDRKRLPTSMADIQTRYSAIPYGWKEIDIASVIARLVCDQRITIKYAGNVVQTSNPRLPDLLRKKTETGKTCVSLRQMIPIVKIRQVQKFLREYFDIMDIPSDEDTLVAFIIEKLGNHRNHYVALKARYDGKKYPDLDLLEEAIDLLDDVLSQQKDNIALVNRLCSRQNDLLDSSEDLMPVEAFFQNQVDLFDAATDMEVRLRNELEHLRSEEEAYEALNKIRLLVNIAGGFDYKKIPMLNTWMNTVNTGYQKLLAAKRAELKEVADLCFGAVTQVAPGNHDVKHLVAQAENYYNKARQDIDDTDGITLLDGLSVKLIQYKDTMCAKIDALSRPVDPPKPPVGPDQPPAPKKNIRSYNRSIVFPAKQLNSDEEIDEYLDTIRRQLKQYLSCCDGIKIN